jgi:hypothetical protein
MTSRNAVIKAKHSPNDQTTKATCITPEAFADLKKAFEDALAFERDERRNLNLTRIQIPCPAKPAIDK